MEPRDSAMSPLTWGTVTHLTVEDLEALKAGGPGFFPQYISSRGWRLPWVGTGWTGLHCPGVCVPSSLPPHRPWSMDSLINPAPWPSTLNFESWPLAPGLGPSRCILCSCGTGGLFGPPCVLGSQPWQVLCGSCSEYWDLGGGWHCLCA